jgi:hypothetical protein
MTKRSAMASAGLSPFAHAEYKTGKRATELLHKKHLDTAIDVGYIRPIPTDQGESTATVKDFLELA